MGSSNAHLNADRAAQVRPLSAKIEVAARNEKGGPLDRLFKFDCRERSGRRLDAFFRQEFL